MAVYAAHWPVARKIVTDEPGNPDLLVLYLRHVMKEVLTVSAVYAKLL